jgi:hypothetical protein
MSELMAPDVALGAFALAVAVIYGAWKEYSLANARDGKLLAAIGSASLLGSALAWLA